MCQEQNYPQFRREPQKKGVTVGLYTIRSFFSFVACRAGKQEKARGRYSCLCISARRFFPLPIFPTFWSRNWDILREVHNAKKK